MARKQKETTERLAERVRAYWATRGFFPRVWIEKANSSGEGMLSWIVRSDMRDGKPLDGRTPGDWAEKPETRWVLRDDQ